MPIPLVAPSSAELTEGLLDEVLPILLGGLALFLYSISHLSRVMGLVLEDRARRAIGRCTGNILTAVVSGTVVTALLGSSSAVIILTIVFINAKALTFRQAIGVILGANIGTTFSSQLIALDIGRYAVVPLITGIAIELFAKSESRRQFGQALLYLGMLFFGLFLMEQSVEPLRDSETFELWMSKLADPLQGALTGGLTTLIIQSSSATVGIAIVLAKQDLIPMSAGLAVMLGAELGTCSDTLLATIRGNRQAVRAGLFHMTFNLTTIIVGLVLFGPFVKLVEAISPSPDVDDRIAHGHMLFNVAGVLLALPFVGLFQRLLEWLVPDRRPHDGPTAAR